MAPGRDLQVEPAQEAAWAQPVERGREAQEERVRAAAWAPRVPLKEPAIRAEGPTWGAPAQVGEAGAAPWVEEPVQVEWGEEQDQAVQAPGPVQVAEADKASSFSVANPFSGALEEERPVQCHKDSAGVPKDLWKGYQRRVKSNWPSLLQRV